IPPPTPQSPKAPAKEYLMVTITSKNSAALPVVNIEGYDAVPPPAQEKTGKRQSASSRQFIYKKHDSEEFLAYDAGLRTTRRTIEMPEPFDILTEENASGGISIVRNQMLGPGRTVMNDFIYRTPVIRMINPAMPLLRPYVEIRMNKYSPGGNQTMVVFLSNFMKAMFAEIEQPGVTVQRRMSLSTFYSYDLLPREGDPERIFAPKLPVLMIPPFDFNIPGDWNSSDPDSFASKVAGAIVQWCDMTRPERNAGVLSFTLSLYSALTDSNLPVLTLDPILLDISLVTDMEPNGK
ncbi:MAG TPA: hypothetical protein VK826_11470, partial [Bacteroidia bacterium]|nr:hypothetical protein [Bacteroidia bacterium]